MINAKSFLVSLAILILGYNTGLAQDRYKTTRGVIEFNASTLLEDIQAKNQQVNAVLNNAGEFAVVLLIRDFEFPRKLMQEHFNENYLESDTYPKSYFVGKIVAANPELISETPINVELAGKLSLHGVTKDIQVPGTVYRTERGIWMESEFVLRPEEYKIDIPTLMFRKIAKEVTVSLAFELLHASKPD